MTTCTPASYNAMVARFDEPLFDAAAIGTEDRVLDIGCGSGFSTRLAARRAPGGRVTGVDVSVPLLERARADTDAGEYPSVSYELGDAQVHPFEPAGHDVAISRGGVMFFADHVAAFTNIARALRPDGRLAFICPQPRRRTARSARRSGCWLPCSDRSTRWRTPWRWPWPRSRTRSASGRCWARRVSRRSASSP
ncbi:class I SAM-dependent methyltransferase [Streptomyces sp. NPDC059757]|uniref:class I SAM-dependent methyltransferase n=1 Tax=Streptomyces sp. NPDC059757 TaxID=3346935 RepID=UPI0036580EAD